MHDTLARILPGLDPAAAQFDGRTVVISGSGDRSVRVWDLTARIRSGSRYFPAAARRDAR
jgi:hypothetical protein